MMYMIFEGLMFLALAGLLFVFQQGLLGWTVFLKSLTSLCFVLAGGCGYIRYSGNRSFSRSVLLGLLCSMAGDVLLAVDQTQGILFVLGVVSFASAHVLFSYAFCKELAVVKTDLLGAFVIFVGLVLLLSLGDFAFHGLFPVLIGYAAIISFMTIKALSFWRKRQERKKTAILIISGGVLFLLSDIVLLFWLFGIEASKWVQCANWILYYFAQGCLAASLSGEKA